jgi:hypothetical protein
MTLPDLPNTEAAIIQQTNAFRAEQRLAAVVQNPVLTRAARAYAEFLARSGLFAHEADGKRPQERTQAAGYRHCIVAENLAMNQDSRGFETRALATQAVDGWKGSPPHRAAMLHPEVTEIGVGIAKAPQEREKYISVQLFGRPESLKYVFRIDNRADVAVRYTFSGRTHALPVRGAVEHTACTGGGVSIEGVASEFKASDGTLFRLTGGGARPLRVDVLAGDGPRVRRN